MAKELPASANEIAAVAEAAGQLGIEKDKVLAFSRTMIDLGEATNLTADEAATALARFANITQMPQDNFDRLGSSIVALGNTMATTEAEIVAMSLRLAGQGKQVGMTEAQIVALAASMSSVGIEAEAGGTAMSTVLKKMQKAVMSGGGALEDWAGVAKMSAKDFKNAYEKDAVTALDAVIKGMAQSGKEGENLTEVLWDLGIKGIRESDTLLRLSGASDILSEAVKTSSDAWEENSALSDEAAQRYETFESKLAMFKNTLTDLGISIGDVLLPFITDMVEKLSGMVDWFTNLNPHLIEAGVVFAAVAAAIALVAGPALLLIGFIPQIVAGFEALMVVISAITGPIGLTVAAIGLIVAALVLAYNKVEWFRDAVDAVWAKIKEATSVAFEKIKAVISDVITKAVEIAKNLLDKLKEFWAKNGEDILDKVKTAFDAVKTTITNIVTDVVSFVKEQLDKFKVFWDENGKAIMELVKLYFGVVFENIKLVMNLIKGVFEVVWPIISGIISVAWELIKTIVSTAIDLVLGIIQTVMKLIQGDWEGAWETIKETADKIWKNIVKFFEEVDLVQIGKDIIDGLIKGITSMVEAVGNTIKNIGNKIKDTFTNLFDIHSPSRVMAGLGKNVGEGIAIGIDSTKVANEKAITGVAKVLSSVARDSAKEVEKIADDAEKKRTAIQEEYAKKRAELSNKTASSSQAALKTHKNKKGVIVTTGEAKVLKIRQDASTKLTKLNDDEQKKLASINDKAWKAMQKKEAAIAKERLEAVKTYVADKKSVEELSLVAESEVWRKSLALFAEGTKERVEVQKGYQAALKAINDEVTKTNEEYAGKMTVINDKLHEEEKKLTDEYAKSVDDRAKSLANFASVFDEFEFKMEKSGEELLWNLKSQLFGFKAWQEEIDKLSAKAIDDGLLAELRAMGPKALPQLIALNSLTERQMTEYSALYKEKSVLARQQAEKELVGMKADTEKRIRDLRAVANTELESLRNDWTAKIAGITKASNDELMSLKKIGRQAAEGLKVGLESMEPALVRTARSIANAVSAEMAKALQVKSPSRVMMRIGRFVGEGLEVGMDDSVGDVMRAARSLANAAVPDMPKVAGYQTPVSGAGVGRSSNADIYSPSTAMGEINLTLNYAGSGGMGDAMEMVDIVERELGSRLSSRQRWNGVKA